MASVSYHTEHERFSSPPLKLMLGQVRFPGILLIEESRFIAEFQESIRHEFPELTTEQQLGLEVTSEGAIDSETSKQWRFGSSDGAWSVVLATDYLTLQANAAQYTDYDDFRRLFRSVWEKFIESIRPNRVVQQGLRYVNHIAKDIPAAEWATFINSEMLGLVASPRFSSQVELAFSDMRLRQPDGLLALKHGIVRAGLQQELGYVLDLDYFAQDLDVKGDVDELIARFDRFHDVIYGFFLWSMTPQALAEFRAPVGANTE